MKDDGRAPLAEGMRYAQIGMLIVTPMLALGALGYWLDRKFRTAPWLLLAGLILGMAAGFTNFLKTVLPPRDGKDGRKGT